MDYIGLKAPKRDVPEVELEALDGRIIDLYNECTLQSVVLDGQRLSFDFLSGGSECVVAQFDRVRNLRVKQPADWDPREAAQIDHLLIREDGPWAAVVFKAGGFEYEFDCDALSLTVTKQ